MLTQKQLKDLLHYNPNTGIFTWVKRTSNRVKVGSAAGHVDNLCGYNCIRVNKKLFRSHRLAFLYMTGSFPKEFVDHINRVRTDNRWCNLRDVSRLENQRNMSLSKRNTSGISGVCFDKSRNSWKVSFYQDGKDHHIGYYKSKDEAIEVRNKSIKKFCFSDGHGT